MNPYVNSNPIHVEQLGIVAEHPMLTILVVSCEMLALAMYQLKRRPKWYNVGSRIPSAASVCSSYVLGRT
jgi:hypothetical protein